LKFNISDFIIAMPTVYSSQITEATRC